MACSWVWSDRANKVEQSCFQFGRARGAKPEVRVGTEKEVRKERDKERKEKGEVELWTVGRNTHKNTKILEVGLEPQSPP